jgi:U3 small nucleolar RNA-associated protein 5
MFISQKYGVSITKQLDSYKLRVFMDALIGELELKEECIDSFLVSISNENNDILGLILSNSVVIYSIKEAKTIQTLEGQFRNIVLGKKNYVVGNGYLYEMKAHKLKKVVKAKNGLLRVQGNLLAVGGYDIELIDLKTHNVKQSFPGHATQINQMVFTPGYLYSSAFEDRFISQWNLKDGSSKSFVVDSCPLQIHANETHLMAYLENGKVAVWDIDCDGEPKGLIELNSQDDEDATFISAGLEGSYIIVAYGSELKPVFEKVAFLDDNNDIKPELVLTRFSPEVQKKVSFI